MKKLLWAILLTAPILRGVIFLHNIGGNGIGYSGTLKNSWENLERTFEEKVETQGQFYKNNTPFPKKTTNYTINQLWSFDLGKDHACTLKKQFSDGDYIKNLNGEIRLGRVPPNGGHPIYNTVIISKDGKLNTDYCSNAETKTT